MSNTFRPHMPGFMDFEPDPSVDFTTMAELLAVPIVQRFMAQAGFYRLSLSGNQEQWLLMAEYKEGKDWYVLGYLKDQIDLPRLDTSVR